MAVPITGTAGSKTTRPTCSAIMLLCQMCPGWHPKGGTDRGIRSLMPSQPDARGGLGKRRFTSILTSSYGVGPAVTNAVPATADRPEASDEDGKSDGDNQDHPRLRPRPGVRGLPTSCFRPYPLVIFFQPRLPTSPRRSTLMCGPSRPPTSTSASCLSNRRQPDDELCISSRSPAEGRVHHKPDGPCPLLAQ